MFPLPRKSEKDLIVSLQTPGPDYKGDPYKYHPMQGLRYWEQWFYIFLWVRKILRKNFLDYEFWNYFIFINRKINGGKEREQV